MTNILRWHDTYTENELENILYNMMECVSDKLENDYCCGILDKEELIQEWVKIGIHKDEAESWYEWID